MAGASSPARSAREIGTGMRAIEKHHELNARAIRLQMIAVHDVDRHGDGARDPGETPASSDLTEIAAPGTLLRMSRNSSSGVIRGIDINSSRSQ